MHTATEKAIMLNSLDTNKKYMIKAINLYPGVSSTPKAANVYSGDFLMTGGFNPGVNLKRASLSLK